MKRLACVAGRAILCALVAAALLGCTALQRRGSAVERLADAYGVDRADEVAELRYTFNVKIGDKVIRRSWSWELGTDRVTFDGSAEQGGRVSYARTDLGAQPPEPLKKIDAWFINDNYWLVFPWRVCWDQGAKVSEDPAPAPLPIGEGTAKRVVVGYPPSGGYTPGDVYELFLDNSGRIVQWVYRKGGDAKPTRVSTWEDYRRLGPLVVSLNRRGPDADFRVWFSDVAVRLKGQNAWTAPE